MPFNKAEKILRIKTFKHIFQLSFMFNNTDLSQEYAPWQFLDPLQTQNCSWLFLFRDQI